MLMSDHEQTRARHTCRAGPKDKASAHDVKGFRASKEEICMEFGEGHWQESLCSPGDWLLNPLLSLLMLETMVLYGT